MAQRLANQEAASAKLDVQGNPLSVERTPAFVRAEPTSSPNASNLQSAPAAVATRSPAAVSAPAPAAVAAPTPATVAPTTAAPAALVAPEPVRQAAGDSRNVNIDFRVLRQNGMITPDNMTSVISNEFRAVKRKLLQKARDPASRAAVSNLVMVTSSLPGEGKTFTSLNLALSLAAERGLHVLLIDADVVRPSIGNVFKMTPREGLTDLLNGKVKNVSDVLCRCVEIPNLSVIFSGAVHAHSPELISSGRMLDLCNDLSKRYPDRIIVIDTPPVLASPEPATLAAYAHQLIMVVAANQTDRHQLRKSLEAVASCRDISLLFNKAPSWNESQYTSYYGYSSPASASTQAASS
jgi:receptor protein-tyrosine kinase